MAQMGFTALVGSVTKYRIRLELSEPNKDGDTWSITANAIVVNEVESKPAENVPVQFYRNGKKEGDPEDTEDDGRIAKEFSSLTKGNHFFEAQIVGTDKRSKKRIVLKEDKPKSSKKIADVDVNSSGKDGNYVISVIVSAEDGSPMNGVNVVFLNGSKAITIPTENGIATHNITFTEKYREITIQIAGAKKQPDLLVLRGPSLQRLIQTAWSEKEKEESGWRVGARAEAMQKGYKDVEGTSFMAKLRASNNFRGNCLLAISGIFLLFNLVVFTPGKLDTPKETPYSQTKERWENLNRGNKPLTNKEMLGSQKSFQQEWGGVFWKTWFALFGIVVIYRVFAQREEIALALKRRRTQSSKDMPEERNITGKPKEGNSPKSMIPSMGKVVTETVAEIGAEAVTEVATKLARKIIKR